MITISTLRAKHGLPSIGYVIDGNVFLDCCGRLERHDNPECAVVRRDYFERLVVSRELVAERFFLYSEAFQGSRSRKPSVTSRMVLGLQ